MKLRGVVKATRWWMLLLGILSLFSINAEAAPSKSLAVTAGEFLVDPPTLINLGFEWVISGDDNRNAKVEVSYRKKGETTWKSGDAADAALA